MTLTSCSDNRKPAIKYALGIMLLLIAAVCNAIWTTMSPIIRNRARTKILSISASGMPINRLEAYCVQSTRFSDAICSTQVKTNKSINKSFSTPPAHCSWLQNMTRRKRNYVPTPTEPPWVSLLANYSQAVASGKNLFVWWCDKTKLRMGRIGNQLFKFAAVFGVAWRNQRIPWWGSNNRKFEMFKHRLAINNFFTKKVSILTFSLRDAGATRAAGAAIFLPLLHGATRGQQKLPFCM